MKSVTFSPLCLVIILTSTCVLWQCCNVTYAEMGSPPNPSPGLRDTLWVPDSYPTIQGAIYASARGGTIMVRPGTYTENLTFDGRPLSLISTGSASVTFIEALSPGQATILFDADDEYISRIEGFTIRDGMWGIRCFGEHQQPYRLTIIDNVVEYNAGGIGLHAISAWVQGNTIRYNYESGGIAIIAEPMIVQNTITDNWGIDGGGITLWLDSANPIIGGSPGMGNVITNNYGTNYTYGHDIYRQIPGNPIDVRYNTWTVYPPTEYIMFPLSDFDTTGGSGPPQIDQEVYLSPAGDNNNSGIDPLHPLRNIHAAIARLVPPTPSNPRILHLDYGIYGFESNLEQFPIQMISNITLLGESMDSVVVDAFNFMGGFFLKNCQNITIANMTIRNSYAQGILSDSCLNLEFRNLNLHHNDSGIWVIGDSVVTVSNCIFAWNESGVSGAGMLASGSYAEIVNCTFYHNISGEYGGGIACFYSGELWVENCIFWGNQAAIISPDIYGSAVPVITVTYTDIEQGWTSTGNISLDPQFVDTSETSPDLHLGFGSPCIDAGNPDPFYNDPNGTRNDMGAYGGPNAQGWMGIIDSRNDRTIPDNLEILALYPNPANPTATLIYQTAKQANVTIDLYNIIGQHITTIRQMDQLPGIHTIAIDGSRFSSGSYFCRLEAGGISATQKFVIVR